MKGRENMRGVAMYHKDREILDREIIKAILDNCEVINIGLYDDEYPYVLPVNFGYDYEDDLIFYMHHAIDGYKNKLVANNPKVCVVTYMYAGHIKNDIDHTSHDYRSVMAFGEMSFIGRDSPDYRKAWEALARGYKHNVPDRVYEADMQVLMAKIVCRPENVIGKAQNPISDISQVPLRGL